MQELTALSYNLRSCRGWDGRVDPQRIADILLSLDADIVGLQEVASAGSRHGDQLAELGRLTGYHSVPGPTLLRHGLHSGTALLSRRPIRAYRHIDLSHPGREPRGALDADLRHDDLPVRVVVTHLGLQSRERSRQVARLMADLERHSSGLFILLGDFNEWLPGSLLLRRLHTQFGRRAAPATFPSFLPLLALDRAWVHHDRRRLRVRVSAVKRRGCRVASDHLPLLTHIRIDPGAAGRAMRSAEQRRP